MNRENRKICSKIPKGDIIKLPSKHRLIQGLKGGSFLWNFTSAHHSRWEKDFPRKMILSCAGNGDRRQFIILSPSVCLLLAQIVILIKTDIIDSRVIKKYSSHKKFTHRSLEGSTLEWFMPFWGVSRFSHCHLCDSKLSPFIAGSVVRGNCCTSILSPYPLWKRKWKAVNDES